MKCHTLRFTLLERLRLLLGAPCYVAVEDDGALAHGLVSFGAPPWIGEVIKSGALPPHPACRLCGDGPSTRPDLFALRRVNEKGVPGIWECSDVEGCRDRQAARAAV